MRARCCVQGASAGASVAGAVAGVEGAQPGVLAVLVARWMAASGPCSACCSWKHSCPCSHLNALHVRLIWTMSLVWRCWRMPHGSGGASHRRPLSNAEPAACCTCRGAEAMHASLAAARCGSAGSRSMAYRPCRMLMAACMVSAWKMHHVGRCSELVSSCSSTACAEKLPAKHVASSCSTAPAESVFCIATDWTMSWCAFTPAVSRDELSDATFVKWSTRAPGTVKTSDTE
mmetsp:Transcript_13811/g.33963  ORF Transcript_13811/g.33963 Transcript_13811/m.33963 type:complete len:231 (+) Transcript_13811:56-748(+)